jgi:deazaflavin-dependent oxidoreductase (nitroreductase family)
MAQTYRAPLFVRIGNVLATPLLRAGVKISINALLTVRGRKSGQPRTTPLAVVELKGQRYLIAAFGIVDWVRNLRAAGAATLTRGRRSEAITVVELPPGEAALILKACLASSPGFVRRYFDTTPESSLEDFEREAVRHPVFQVHAAPSTVHRTT